LTLTLNVIGSLRPWHGVDHAAKAIVGLIIFRQVNLGWPYTFRVWTRPLLPTKSQEKILPAVTGSNYRRMARPQ